jgi:hypothetical protein
MKRDYDGIVIGASCAGLGAALQSDESILVIEPSACIGWDLTETLYPGTDWESIGDLTPLSTDLRAECERRHILAADRIHIPALSPVLCQRLADSRVSYLFQTQPISAEASSDGISVMTHNCGGRSRFHARWIIDTTTRFLSQPNTPVHITSTAIGAALNHRSEETQDLVGTLDCDSAHVYPGYFPGEAYLNLKLDHGASWPEARHALHEFWMNKPSELQSWDIASTATRLTETCESAETGRSDWIHLPSVAFANALLAFDAGTRAVTAQEVLV